MLLSWNNFSAPSFGRENPIGYCSLDFYKKYRGKLLSYDGRAILTEEEHGLGCRREAQATWTYHQEKGAAI
jgi:hypothetical protein